MRVTVDASVAVKWFVSEEGRREALMLTGPRIERHAPDLMLPECANVIWKKHRRGEIPSAQPFIDQIAELSEAMPLHPGAELGSASGSRRTRGSAHVGMGRKR